MYVDAATLHKNKVVNTQGTTTRAQLVKSKLIITKCKVDELQPISRVSHFGMRARLRKYIEY